MMATLKGGPLDGRELTIGPGVASIHVPFVSSITGGIFIVKYDRAQDGYVWRDWMRSNARANV